MFTVVNIITIPYLCIRKMRIIIFDLNSVINSTVTNNFTVLRLCFGDRFQTADRKSNFS